ncbi:hypothetical protein BH10PSE2_BH10PSE2_29450 [soil metagenome]
MGPMLRLGRAITVAVLTGLSLAAVGGCATLKDRLGVGLPRASVSSTEMPGALETIHAAAMLNNVAVFWVSSNGCTGRDDLRPMVSTSGDASVITLRRINEDSCKTPLNDGVEVMWWFEELGIKPGAHISVNNPYQLPTT